MTHTHTIYHAPKVTLPSQGERVLVFTRKYSTSELIPSVAWIVEDEHDGLVWAVHTHYRMDLDSVVLWCAIEIPEMPI